MPGGIRELSRILAQRHDRQRRPAAAAAARNLQSETTRSVVLAGVVGTCAGRAFGVQAAAQLTHQNSCVGLMMGQCRSSSF